MSCSSYNKSRDQDPRAQPGIYLAGGSGTQLHTKLLFTVCTGEVHLIPMHGSMFVQKSRGDFGQHSCLIKKKYFSLFLKSSNDLEGSGPGRVMRRVSKVLYIELEGKVRKRLNRGVCFITVIQN